VDNSCVGCGVCGDNVHSAVLCPSFSKIDLLSNPNSVDTTMARIRRGVISWFERRDQRRELRQAL